MHKQIPQAHFVIVGDGPEREKLEVAAGSAGMSGQIHFVGSTQDVPGVLSAMDLFSLTSHNEASPVSILEAMSCQLPVVAPNVGSISHSVLHGETGFVVNRGDAEEYARCWFKMLTDSSLAHQLGERARNHVIEYGSLESMTVGYEDLLCHLYEQKVNKISGDRHGITTPSVSTLDAEVATQRSE